MRDVKMESVGRSFLFDYGDTVIRMRYVSETTLQWEQVEVRVNEALVPSGQYHLRYGQFARRADAQAYREALARRGIGSRVVKVR